MCSAEGKLLGQAYKAFKVVGNVMWSSKDTQKNKPSQLAQVKIGKIYFYLLFAVIKRKCLIQTKRNVRLSAIWFFFLPVDGAVGQQSFKVFL